MNRDHNYDVLSLRALFVFALAIMLATLLAAYLRINWRAALAVFAGEMATIAAMAALHELRLRDVAPDPDDMVTVVCPRCGIRCNTPKDTPTIYCPMCGTKLEREDTDHAEN